MLNCRKTSQLLSQSLDLPLSFKERLSLLLHLMMCNTCRCFAQQLRFLHKTVTALETHVLADERLKLNEPARERIKRTLHSPGENDPMAQEQRK